MHGATSAPQSEPPVIDTLLAGLILAGGTDRLSEILKAYGGGAGGENKSAERPIEITGRLVLDQGRKDKASKAEAAN